MNFLKKNKRAKNHSTIMITDNTSSLSFNYYYYYYYLIITIIIIITLIIIIINFTQILLNLERNFISKCNLCFLTFYHNYQSDK